MSAPLIGITPSRITIESGISRLFVSEAYTQRLINAGSLPVIIPLGLSHRQMDSLLNQLNGILFSGGGDINPSRYGNAPHPLVSEIDDERDELEVCLVHRLVESVTPFMGICRGIQVINVALGGSLYEDIRDQKTGSLNHQYGNIKKRDYLAHSISLDGTSLLADILGKTETRVNSLHHQGIKELAARLIATAHAEDGIIEAIEVPEHPFGIAVQWHPECLPEVIPMQNLFKAFVSAAGR